MRRRYKGMDVRAGGELTTAGLLIGLAVVVVLALVKGCGL